MASGVLVKVEGLGKVLKKIGSIPRNVAEKTDEVMLKTSSGFVERAVNAAPVDQGILRQGISYQRLAEMEYEIVSSAFQSPFIEWGTRTRMKVPADQTAYAQQFAGRTGGGDYYDFLNAILDWVKRKGIASRFSVKTRRVQKHTKADDERLIETAQAIANSIIRHGIHPHPFFFPQLPLAQEQLKKGVAEAVKNALK